MRLPGFGKKRAATGDDRAAALERLAAEDANARKVLDRHFALHEDIQRWCRQRDTNPKARAKAIERCQAQIACSDRAAWAFHELDRIGAERGRLLKLGLKPVPSLLPGHTGFTQLAIIREKDGDFTEAIRLCQQAKHDGWAGDWDKRIARLEAKRARMPRANKAQ